MRLTVPSASWLLGTLCLACVAPSDDELVANDSADIFSVDWPAAQAAPRADGTWAVERRWDDSVRRVSYEQAFSKWVATVHSDSNGFVEIGAPPSAVQRRGGDELVVPVLDCADWALALRFAFAATHRLSFTLQSSTAIVNADTGFVGSATRDANPLVQAFLEGLGLDAATALFGTTVMARFRSADLADDRNTYLVEFEAAHAGDLISDPHHTRVIGELNRRRRGRVELELVQGGPGAHPQWSPTSIYDVMAGVQLGSGPRRFRSETSTPTTINADSEFAEWREALNVNERQLFSIAVQTYKSAVLSRRTSCASRTRLYDAMVREYRALHEETGLTWPQYVGQSEFDSYAIYYPELSYEQSPTCAWNPSAEENNQLATVEISEPFVMTNNAYPMRLPVRWRNDEGRTFRRMSDVVTARMCQGLIEADDRAYAGCSGAYGGSTPRLSTEM